MTKKILVVDDEGDLRMVLKLMFAQHENLEVIEAEDGKEGVEQASSEVPDLIIMDYKMPVMNGIEAIREIKANRDLSNIPILLFTAFISEADQGELVDLGCEETLNKPVDFKEWDAILTKYLK